MIRLATGDDRDALWDILAPNIRAGETYALPAEWDRDAALAYWLSPSHEVFVAECDGRVVGTYYMRVNQPGGGSHVANCGYMVAPDAWGQGVARSLGQHSLARARERGFRAIQFNFVVSANERAVRLWQSLGWQIVGRLPGAFAHPRLGFVDVYVLHQAL